MNLKLHNPILTGDTRSNLGGGRSENFLSTNRGHFSYTDCKSVLTSWLQLRIPMLNWMLRGLLGVVPHTEAPDQCPFKSVANE